MILELSMMAIVVSSPSSVSPPPPATGIQQQCKYSVRETSKTYVCYTEQEYIARQEAQLKASEESTRQLGQSISNSFAWFIGHWWQCLLVSLGLFVAFIVLVLVIDVIERKRHPERFDSIGIRKDWYI